jgi:hypothetical protein
MHLQPKKSPFLGYPPSEKKVNQGSDRKFHKVNQWIFRWKSGGSSKGVHGPPQILYTVPFHSIRTALWRVTSNMKWSFRMRTCGIILLMNPDSKGNPSLKRCSIWKPGFQGFLPPATLQNRKYGGKMRVVSYRQFHQDNMDFISS